MNVSALLGALSARTPVGAGWYGEALSGVDPIDSSGPLGALKLLIKRPRAAAYFVQSRTRGAMLLSIFAGITGRRRIVFLEFIRVERAGVKGLIDFAYVKLLTLGCRRLHVLTPWERDVYGQRYRIGHDRLHTVMWPLSDDRSKPSERALPEMTTLTGASSNFVMASGRAACDWQTLLRARSLAEVPWDLVIVCSSADRYEVDLLTASHSGIWVLSDVAPETHRALVKSAAVYALVLKEEARSSGHIRLMESIDCCTPVVASDSLGLRGYAIDRCTARVVPVGDSQALALAVDHLMAHPEARAELVESAASYSSSRTFTSYLKSIGQLANAT